MAEDRDTVIDFESRSVKHRDARAHRQKEEKVDNIKRRFESLFPDKPRPVKDYLAKKKRKKKR